MIKLMKFDLQLYFYVTTNVKKEKETQTFIYIYIWFLLINSDPLFLLFYSNQIILSEICVK